MATCSLLAGPLQKLLQVVLLIASLSVLGLKHKWEQSTGRSNRSTARFFFDSSKQLAGAAWMHVLNLLCAQALAVATTTDSCEWYWVEIMVDTTLGVYVEYCTMQLIISLKHWHSLGLGELVGLLQESCMDSLGGKAKGDGAQDELLQAGVEDPTGLEDILASLNKVRYAAQLLVWLLVVTIMKLVMLTIMGVFGPQLLDIAALVLGLLKPMPFLELVFVMILTPVVMDAVQFVLQDNIFVDLDEGYLVEKLPPRRAPARKTVGNAVLQQIWNDKEQVKSLIEDNDDLRVEIEALRAELKYQRSGFLARIILSSFVGVEDDQPGLYRVLRTVQTYQRPEYPLLTFTEVIQPPGRVIQVVELREGDGVKWARIRKPADHWIMLVNGKGKRCARKLATPSAELGVSEAAVVVAAVA